MLDIINKIKDHSARVVIIGLGYVGLPMATEIALAGYNVYGIDIDPVKIAELHNGRSYIIDIKDQVIASIAGNFHVGTEYDVISQADIVIICVPTPLARGNQPDTSYIESAIQMALPYLKKETLIILESTTYPGTTEELIRQVVEDTNTWSAGEDFYVCYSPERVDPGSKDYHVKNTPKIIGGSTPNCQKVGVEFYGGILDRIVPVSSTMVAETAKLFENTFRSVNIALVNGMVPMCEKAGFSIWEVIDAAATKPFGYMTFYPGPGIGGHCIPIDPLYLAWKSEQYGIPLEFIQLADRTNHNMTLYLVERITEMLKSEGKTINRARIVLVGMAYKKDIDDVRESPAMALFQKLREEGADVCYTDPFVSQFRLDKEIISSVAPSPRLWSESDMVVITTDHSKVDYQSIADHAPFIFDTRNVMKTCQGGRIVVLGNPG